MTDSKSQESHKPANDVYNSNHHQSLQTEATVVTKLVDYPGEELYEDAGAIHVESNGKK